MSDAKTLEALEVKRAELNIQTAEINWLELQKHFAGGSVIYISPELDLIDAALAVQEDNAESVKKWMDDRLIHPATDEQAKEWFEAKTEFWAVVIKPMVLVQPRA